MEMTYTFIWWELSPQSNLGFLIKTMSLRWVKKVHTLTSAHLKPPTKEWSVALHSLLFQCITNATNTHDNLHKYIFSLIWSPPSNFLKLRTYYYLVQYFPPQGCHLNWSSYSLNCYKTKQQPQWFSLSILHGISKWNCTTKCYTIRRFGYLVS